jgi:hypothetical protein
MSKQHFGLRRQAKEAMQLLGTLWEIYTKQSTINLK